MTTAHLLPTRPPAGAVAYPAPGRSSSVSAGGRLFAFACRVADASWETIINAPTAGKARYRYWLLASDAWPDLPFTAVRVRKVGGPRTSDMLRYVGEMRGMRLAAGDRVIVRGLGPATVCGGGGGGAYFEVWADDGRHGYCHPFDVTAEDASR